MSTTAATAASRAKVVSLPRNVLSNYRSMSATWLLDNPEHTCLSIPGADLGDKGTLEFILGAFITTSLVLLVERVRFAMHSLLGSRERRSTMALDLLRFV